MDAIRSILLAATIILFAIGAWPISIITITIFATLSVVKSNEEKKKFQELQSEIEKLKERLNNLENREGR